MRRVPPEPRFYRVPRLGRSEGTRQPAEPRHLGQLRCPQAPSRHGLAGRAYSLGEPVHLLAENRAILYDNVAADAELTAYRVGIAPARSQSPRPDPLNRARHSRNALNR